MASGFKANGTDTDDIFMPREYTTLGVLLGPNDNYLYVWGNNTNGELGLDDRTDRSSPVQVGTLSDWNKVSSGLYHTIVTKK